MRFFERSTFHQHGNMPVISIMKPHKGSSTALVLSTHKSAKHDFQAVWKNPNDQDPKRSKRKRDPAQWAVWVQTPTQHCTTASPAHWNSVQELWREKANRRFFPGCGQGLRYCVGRRSTRSPFLTSLSRRPQFGRWPSFGKRMWFTESRIVLANSFSLFVLFTRFILAIKKPFCTKLKN